MLIAAFGAGLAQEKSAALKPSWIIFVYPTALVAGDASAGLECRPSKKIGFEGALNCKLFAPKIYEYDHGYRTDFLFKYYLLEKSRFSLSLNFSLVYKNVWFSNKVINYYSFEGPASDFLLQTTVEDKRWQEYGAGTGLTINFKLTKQIVCGLDLSLNCCRQRISQHHLQYLYSDTNFWPTGSNVPHTAFKNSFPVFMPFGRFKIGYKLGKRS